MRAAACEEGGGSTGEGSAKEGGGSTEQEAAAETATEAQLEGEETRVGASLENSFARMCPCRNRRVCDVWKVFLLQHDALSPNVECVSVELTVADAISVTVCICDVIAERLAFSKPEHVTFSDNKDRFAEFVTSGITPAAHRACQWSSVASL